MTEKTVKASELSIIKMVGNNEKKYKAVIENGILKDWIGFGWIDIRTATKEDHQKFPIVIYE